MKYLFHTLLFSLALASPLPLSRQSYSVDTTLRAAHNSTNVALIQKGDNLDALQVTVTRKQAIRDDKYDRIIAQAVTDMVFHFDLSPARKIAHTVHGIPLKLYPVETAKLSTFGTFLPPESDGYYEDRDFGHDDDDEQRHEPLLWQGTQDAFDAKVVLEVTIPHCSSNMNIVIRTWTVDEDELEPMVAKISKDQDTMRSLKSVVLHYYRGSGSRTYTKMQEIYEIVHTALVSFLSPFVILGVVLIGIVVCVFIFCDLFYSRSSSSRIRLDDNVDSKRDQSWQQRSAEPSEKV